MGISIKPVIRKHAFRNDNTTSIYIVVTINSDAQYKATEVVINCKNWDDKRLQVKSCEPLCINKNLALNAIIQRMEIKKYELIQAGKVVTHELLFSVVDNADFTNFKEYATEAIKRRPIKPQGKRALTTFIELFESYKKGLSLQDITPGVIDGFRAFLKQKEYQHNYQIQVLSKIRLIVLDAVKNKVLKENPFEFVTVGSYKPRKEYLTHTELMTLIEKMPELSKPLQAVLKRFCFCCCTSFRFSDAAQLDYSMLRQHKRGYYFSITQKKTDENQLVPLSDLAITFIEVNKTNGSVFENHTQQYTNRALKAIFERLEIKRDITTHVARHTFITVTQELGGNTNVAGKIAGHKSEATKAGYSHYNLEMLFDAVEKWNQKKAQLTSSPSLQCHQGLLSVHGTLSMNNRLILKNINMRKNAIPIANNFQYLITISR